MRVLGLTNLYPNPYQPTRAAFNRQDFALLAERHAVHVIAPILWTDERNADRRLLPPSRRVTHDGLTVDHPVYWYTPKVLRGQYGRFFRWSVAGAFRRAVAEFRPDIVYTPWTYPDGWAAVRLAREAGLPAVVKVLGSDLRTLDEFPGRRARTAETLRLADAVVTVSQDLATRAAELGADPARVRVIYSGVDRRTFAPGDRAAARRAVGLPDDGTRHLLAVGNLVPIKGHDVLLDALARLPAEVGPWRLHLVGGGVRRDALAGQAARLGLADRVAFHGPRPHAELPDWFRAADLFVLPSRSEGVPNVFLEAAACGAPIVATAVGGVPEVAHLAACRLVPPDDPWPLARAVAAALAAPPPAPPDPPRDRREVVDDLEAVMAKVVERGRPPTALHPPLAASRYGQTPLPDRPRATPTPGVSP